MKKTLIALIAVAALGLCSSAYAHTSFSFGLGFSPAPVYYSTPVYYAPPAPVYYAPAEPSYYPAPADLVYFSGVPYQVVFYGGYRHYVRYDHHRY